jgi:hypothetical protein
MLAMSRRSSSELERGSYARGRAGSDSNGVALRNTARSAQQTAATDKRNLALKHPGLSMHGQRAAA